MLHFKNQNIPSKMYAAISEDSEDNQVSFISNISEIGTYSSVVKFTYRKMYLLINMGGVTLYAA